MMLTLSIQPDQGVRRGEFVDVDGERGDDDRLRRSGQRERG
jgi:hypothetical protein